MGKVKQVLQMIKFEHSVFALPFALMSAFLAEKQSPSFNKLLWIIVAMVSARSAAMAFNRIADLKYDRINPRTLNWPLPKGELSINFVIVFIIVSVSIFFISAYLLNKICFYLSPIALLIIITYSYSKRFSFMTHFHLGLSLSLAPMGAWLAITEHFHPIPVLISTSVILWVAVFDILYATQDIDFDKKNRLHSIPVQFGIRNSLIISSVCHAIMIIPLIIVYFIADLGLFYLLGIIIASVFLIRQHAIVAPNNLSRVNEAFFTLNGLLSVSLFIFTALDISMHYKI